MADPGPSYQMNHSNKQDGAGEKAMVIDGPQPNSTSGSSGQDGRPTVGFALERYIDQRTEDGPWQPGKGADTEASRKQGQPKLNEDVLHSILAKITTESTKKPPKAS